jgi:signal transduction histidine kinase
MRELRRIDWGRAADVTIVAGLLGSGYGQLAWGHSNGAVWVNAVLMTAIALPALWRRSSPGLAFTASMTAILVVFLVYYPSGEDGPGEAWFAFLIMTFSLALYGKGRARTAATLYGAAAFAAINAGQLVVGTDPFDVLTAWVFPVIVWLGGWALQRRQTAADQSRRRAEAAEKRAVDARMAVELERSRIARELHDIVAHSVSVMVLQAGAARQVLATDPQRAENSLGSIERTGRQAIDEMRRLLGILRREGDELPTGPPPGLGQLDELSGQLRDAGIHVKVELEGTPRDLPPSVDLSAYRVVQEGVTNVLRHSGAASATVRVRYGPDRLELEVLDDGTAPSANGTRGFGLVGMRERLAVFGGTLDASPRPEGGFALRARIPLQETDT